MADTEKVRWTDHWEVRVMCWALILVVTGLCSGAGWLTSKVISNDSKNAEQDGRMNATTGRLDSIERKLDKIDDKLDELRKPK